MPSIVVNGKAKYVPEESVLNYIMSIPDFEPDHVILEYNDKILKRFDWEKTVLKENDHIELIHFVGGG